jgi:pyruvate dehydrogenase E1 component alpha subunit
VRGYERERPADAFVVDSPHQAADRFGSDTGAAPRRLEPDLVAAPTRAGGGKEREYAASLRLVLDHKLEPSVAPPRIQALLDRIPLLGEPHRANRTLTAVAKVEEKKAALRKDELKDVLREMLLIRRFEEKVEERFRAGELPGFLHVAIGQEAAAVGVCRALADGDVIASTHRAHGHTLAKGTHPNELMAELYGKSEGCSHGYGGSMHLFDVEHGNMGANAVIGGGLPHITGAALAFQLRGEPRVAVAFFGDGATNIGAFHEALNLAQLWKVPAVFVLEDNKWAESTPEWQHSPIRDLSDRAKAFGMKAVKVDGQDVEAVYKSARQALEHARSGKGPVFMHVDCVRLHGHYIGDPQVYRDKDGLAVAQLRHRRSSTRLPAPDRCRSSRTRPTPRRSRSPRRPSPRTRRRRPRASSAGA